jgi:hypothetical protein
MPEKRKHQPLVVGMAAPGNPPRALLLANAHTSTVAA